MNKPEAELIKEAMALAAHLTDRHPERRCYRHNHDPKKRGRPWGIKVKLARGTTPLQIYIHYTARPVDLFCDCLPRQSITVGSWRDAVNFLEQKLAETLL